jgi:tetratricopeptide (TPR) repeat protein
VAGRAPLGSNPAALQDAFASAAKGDNDRARLQFADVIASRPGSMDAALARDALADFNQARLFTAPRYSCPAESVQAYERAEDLLPQARHAEAIAQYRKAVDGCPQNADMWIHFGEAFFEQGDYEQARDLFHEGVLRDPWNRSGHRFLADAELHLNHVEAAYHRATLAVVSDPTYEAGWHFLQDVVWRLGGEWRRAFVVKPTLTVNDGKPTIRLPADAESEILPHGNNATWISYVMLRHRGLITNDATAVFPSDLQASPREATQTALQCEQAAVDKTLKIYEELIAQKPEQRTKFWDQMRRARDSGFLREAIFLHLMDRELAAEYAAYRDQNGERLVRYVEQQLAPLTRTGVRQARAYTASSAPLDMWSQRSAPRR